MLLSTGIILIVIAIFVLIFLAWWYHDSSDDQMPEKSSFQISEDQDEINNYPTIHARCRKDPKCDGTTCVSDCGGDLTCDKICHRCKKKIHGSCSSDVDCETGLICHNWKCVPQKSTDNISIENLHDEVPNSFTDKKHIYWNDKYEIFKIPPRNIPH